MAFDHKYPKPKSTDEVDPKDLASVLEVKEAMIRERRVQEEMHKILQERLRQCYFREGVNHFDACKEIRDRVEKQRAKCDEMNRYDVVYNKDHVANSTKLVAALESSEE
eukprot:Clim_evm12s215 gene=Clim_evmTU12s215